jgi:hypothetical protein
MSITPSPQYSLTIRSGGAGHRADHPRVRPARGHIVPSVFNRDVSPAVAERAKEQGAATVAGDTIGFAAIDAERLRSTP